MRVDKRLKTYGAVKRELHEKAVVATVTYGVETLGMRLGERHKLGVASDRDE